MEQLLFKMVAESAKSGIGQMLSNGQNLQIMNELENAGKASGLSEKAEKLSYVYENCL